MQGLWGHQNRHSSGAGWKTRTVRLEDTENFVPRDKAHLRNTVRVTEGDTDLGRRETFARELNELLNDVLWRRF